MNLLRKTRERLNERGMELLWDFEERQGIMTNEKKKTERKIRLTGKQKRNIQREKHRYNLKNIL